MGFDRNPSVESPMFHRWPGPASRLSPRAISGMTHRKRVGASSWNAALSIARRRPRSLPQRPERGPRAAHRYSRARRIVAASTALDMSGVDDAAAVARRPRIPRPRRRRPGGDWDVAGGADEKIDYQAREGLVQYHRRRPRERVTGCRRTPSFAAACSLPIASSIRSSPPEGRGLLLHRPRPLSDALHLGHLIPFFTLWLQRVQGAAGHPAHRRQEVPVEVHHPRGGAALARRTPRTSSPAASTPAVRSSSPTSTTCAPPSTSTC